MSLDNKNILLIAGNGDLPILIEDRILQMQCNLFVADLLNRNVWKSENIFPCKPNINDIIDIIKKQKIDHIVAVGGIKFKGISSIIRLSYRNFGFILQLFIAIARLKILGDDALINTIINHLESNFGVKVLAPSEIAPDLITFRNVNSNLAKEYKEDISFGKDLLNTIAKFDIGQAIVVQNKRCIAIEAQEGTKNMISRASELFLNSSKKAVLIKKPKLNQNMKIDIPTIGLETIKDAFSLGFAGIAIEKGCVIVLNQSEIIEFLQNKQFFIVNM